MNRKIFIVSLVAVLAVILVLVGYSIYQKTQTPKKTGEFSPTLQVTNYQIPAGKISTFVVQPAEITPSSGGKTISQKPTGSIPPQSVIPPAISQNYIKFYQDSITNFNKISPAINDVQQTLVVIQQKYQSGDNNALPPLISQANSQNSVLSAGILNFKNSLDSWLIANYETNDAPIKSKTGETIQAGKDFSQSASDFSDATAGILNYTGTGDLNQLSQQFQAAAQRVSDGGKILTKLFTELNNAFSSL